MPIQTTRPHQRQNRRRSAELMLGTALGGALIVLAGATPAAADNECGAPVAGVVTCTAAGGPYNAGVRYTSAVELRVDPGTVINGGLDISGTGAIFLPQGTGLARPSVTQTGNARAVSLVTNSGQVFAFLDDVSSTGPTGTGIFARSTASAVTVHADVITAGNIGVDLAGSIVGAQFNQITLASNGAPGAGILAVSSGGVNVGSTRLYTTGDNLVGMDVTGQLNVIIRSSVLTTDGANAHGIIANALNGSAATLTTGTIETHGDDSIGIDVSGGDITVTNTSVTTHGARSGGVVATSTGGTVSITSDLISTAGDDSTGLKLDSAGPTTVDVSAISTVGDRSHGIDAAIGGTGLVRFDSVVTQGDYSSGVTAEALTGAAVTIEGGDIVTGGLESHALDVATDDTRLQAAVGDIVTHGEGAKGVYAASQGGDLVVVTRDITTDGRYADAALLYNYGGGLIDFTASDITTTGRGASGVFAQNEGGESRIHLATVTTSGLRANGVELYRGDANVTVTGAIVTSGDEADGVTTTEVGDVILNLGDVTTTGDDSDGVDIDLDPGSSNPVTVDITAGQVSTAGARSRGLHVVNRGTTTIRAASVSTASFESDAIHVDGAGEGDASITVTGAITTQQEYSNGVEVVDAASANISVSDVTTSGSFSDAILVRSSGSSGFETGPATVVARDLATSGQDSYGVNVQSEAGDVSVSVRNVTTTGERSVGVAASAAGAHDVTVSAGNVSTSAVGSTGIRAISEDGDVSVTAGNIVASAANTSALVVGSEDGDILVDVGDVFADGSNVARAISVWLESADATLDLTAGNVRTRGRDSTAVMIAAVGAADITLGDVSAQGLRSDAIRLDGRDVDGLSSGSVALDVGDVSTAGQYGAAIRGIGLQAAVIRADSVTATGEGAAGIQIAATGDVLIDVAGAINVAGGTDASNLPADAVQVETLGDAEIRTGAITTTAVGAEGIDVNARDVVVDVNGRITTAGDEASGVWVLASRNAEIIVGSVVTAGSEAYGVYANADGAVSISSSDIATSGTGAHGVWVEGDDETATVAINVGRVVAGGQDAVGVLAVGRDVELSVGTRVEGQAAGADLTAGEDATARIAAGATLTGGDVGLRIEGGASSRVVNQGVISALNGYAIDADGAAATIDNAGTLLGRIDLTDNADVFVNGGTFRASGVSDFGGGADVLNSTGILTLERGASNTGSASLGGLERFNNAGRIDLSNGHAGDTLSIDGVLNGLTNNRILMDMDLTGATPAADRLTVGALEGVNNVELHVQGRGAVGDTGVTLIVSGANQTGNEVALTTVGGGFLSYEAVFDAASREFRVVAGAARQAFEPTRIGSGAQAQWRRSADMVSARFDDLRDSRAMSLRRGDRAQFWAQAFGGTEEVDGERRFSEDGTESVDLTHDVDTRGAQFGVDVVRGLGGGDLVLGLAASVNETELTFQSNGDTAEFSGGGVGAYAQWNRGPLAVGVLAKADKYELDYRFLSADLRDSADGRTVGARIDAAWALVANGDWTVEPQASLAWTETDLDGIEGDAGEVEFGDTRSLLSRAGVRAARTVRLENGAVVQPFIGVHALREFDGENVSHIHLDSQTMDVTAPGGGVWSQVTVGANLGLGAVQGFAQGEATLGDVRGYTARVGVRLNW